MIVFCGFLVSCEKYYPQPIEKFKGKGYVIVEEPATFRERDFKVTQLKVKSQDTVKKIYVPHFDAKNLKVGDTIK